MTLNDFLVGSEKDFYDFLDSIKSEDKIGILTHNDLDGIASAVFLEKILEAKKKEVTDVEFLSLKKGMFDAAISNFKSKDITKVFVLDITAENVDSEGFQILREEFGVFLIDHHPINEDFVYDRNIIKSGSDDCSSWTVYNLGKEFIDLEEWGWLVCSAMFADFSYKKQENLEFIQSIYPDITAENISYSKPGIIGRKISSALVYYLGDVKKVYDLVVNKNLSELNEVHEIVEGEVNRCVDEFFDKAKFYPEKELYIYEVNSDFGIVSYVTTVVSKMKLDFSFVSYQGRGIHYKVSARNQSKKRDMNELMKKGIEGLENANGGGHAAASAALLLREDLNKFIENILR